MAGLSGPCGQLAAALAPLPAALEDDEPSFVEEEEEDEEELDELLSFDDDDESVDEPLSAEAAALRLSVR